MACSRMTMRVVSGPVAVSSRMMCAEPTGHSRASSSRRRGGSAARTTVTSLAVNGHGPTLWWMREPTPGQSGSTSRM
ncbi:Uncharacterised protein [Mycobacteroides abscessus subsp. abscessus]|nr:Uncharacterised protein [Mycobacteroides abscessus subsp. abscessus]